MRYINLRLTYLLIYLLTYLPAAAGKAKAGMAHSDFGRTCGCAGKEPLRTRAIPERFCGGDSLGRGAISSVWTYRIRRTAAGGCSATVRSRRARYTAMLNAIRGG